jgi:hypothetical protein
LDFYFTSSDGAFFSEKLIVEKVFSAFVGKKMKQNMLTKAKLTPAYPAFQS